MFLPAESCGLRDLAVITLKQRDENSDLRNVFIIIPDAFVHAQYAAQLWLVIYIQ